MSGATYQRINLKAWLRLIRWPNLLIVALTQFVAWWCVVYPFNGVRVLILTPLNFLLLCLSTVLIAAGGYIINDYFDVRIDVINKPEKVVLERDIPRKLAIIVHSLLNVVAMFFAALVAVPAGHPEWLLLQLTCTALLWRYSTTWKRQFMIGNVVVSLMTALTIIALIIYEPSLFGSHDVRPGWHTIIGRPLYGIDPLFTLGAFALFAFLLTWMREIVKDMEDYKGDDAEGCVTMPIRWGLLGSSRFVQVLGCVAIAILAYALIWMGMHIVQPWRHVPLYFILGTVIIPLAVWCCRLPQEATAEHYHLVSKRLKDIMIFGVLSLALLSSF